VADSHLTGPGLAALNLPAAGSPSEAYGYRWLGGSQVQASQLYRYREIAMPAGAAGLQPLATTPDGKCFCAALDRGAGRLIYLALPRGMGIDQSAHPVLPRLFAHLTRGLMPVEVRGDVNWLVNRTPTGWVVTLLNPAGQDKPQHGITPTDYRQNRRVEIVSRVSVTTARDRLLPGDPLAVENGIVTVEVQAGGVRLVELK
jgi:hypothetical protein